MKNNFEKYCTFYNEEICVTDKSEKYSGNDLKEMYKSIKNKLIPIKNSTVCILFENSIEFIVSFFAVVESNLNVFPLYYRMTDSEMKNAMTNVNSFCCITTTKQKDIFDDYINIEGTGLIIGTIQGKEDNTTSYNNCVFFLTSGTTGSKQKIVVHDLVRLYLNSSFNANILELTKKEIGMIILPMNFIYVINTQILLYIKRYIKFNIVSSLSLPKVVEKLLIDSKSTIITITPSYFKLFKNISLNKTYLKTILYGGEKANWELVNNVLTHSNINVFQSYGQTELGSRVSIKKITCMDDMDNVGKVVDESIKVRIDKIEGHNYGKIFIKSPSVMIGYYPTYFNDTFLDTGDIGYIDEKQEIHLLGRSSNWIKHKEIRFNPIYIEEELSGKFPTNAFLYKKENVDLVLYVESEEEVVFTTDFVENLKNYINENYSYYMRPTLYKFLLQLPRTVSNKIKRGEDFDHKLIFYAELGEKND